MSMSLGEARDVMLVCANGHVITDRLHAQPERHLSHCERCGAATLRGCPTCGSGLPGAAAAPGLTTVGEQRPPRYCGCCGAAFPWNRRAPIPAGPWPALEALLRRLPRAVRELQRQRAGRQPFRLDSEHDLEYVLRGFLPLCCDDVRLRSRTPAYSPGPRTDFLLMPGGTVLVSRFVLTAGCEDRLVGEIRADADHHGRQRDCRTLAVFVYDPLGFLRPAERLEAAWSAPDGDLPLRCVIAG